MLLSDDASLLSVVQSIQERTYRNERDIMAVLASVTELCRNIESKIDGQSEAIADVQRQITELIEKGNTK